MADQTDAIGSEDTTTPIQRDVNTNLKTHNLSNETGSGVIKISKAHAESEKYTITSGIARVINNTEFYPSLKLKDRTGSDLDASSLIQRFAELGFENDLLNDATFKDIEEEFDKIKQDKKNLKKTDCLVVVFLTHGDENGIYATDQQIKVETLMDKFNAKNCPELILKPKIFIFQACRGRDIGRGVNAKVNTDKNEADAVGEYYDYDVIIGKTICIPNEADFLAVYATSSGYGAFRNSDSGSPFVRHLSEELINMEKDEDFYKVLTRVNRRVGTGYKPNIPNSDDVTQMPCFISHLTKDLVLKQK